MNCHRAKRYPLDEHRSQALLTISSPPWKTATRYQVAVLHSQPYVHSSI